MVFVVVPIKCGAFQLLLLVLPLVSWWVNRRQQQLVALSATWKSFLIRSTASFVLKIPIKCTYAPRVRPHDVLYTALEEDTCCLTHPLP